MKNEIDSKVKKVLKELVSSKSELLQARESILGSKDENTSLISQLLDELIAPKENYSIIRGDKVRDDSVYTGKRDIQKISLILKLLPQLKKFFVFNKIGYDALRTAAFFLELRRIPKNTYVFQQGQVSDVFYGIIQGRISIRSQKKVKHARRRTTLDMVSAIEDYRVETVEEELNVLTSGSYFGEVGIMERKERTAAAYALEDSDLFCLDAKAFESSFGKYIIKAENERKNFLVNLIKPISMLPRSKFNLIYRNFIRAHFVSRNEVIYTEGTLANKFYIIYEGQFRLKKKNLSEKKENEENYYQSDVARHPVVLNLTNGDFAGLEAFLNCDLSCIARDSTSNGIYFTAPTNSNEITQTKQNSINLLTHTQPSEKIKYKNSLITESEFSVVFSLDPNLLGCELRRDLFEFLKPIFEKKEKFISEIFKNHQMIKEKMKINYREKLITEISKNNNNHLLDKIDKIGKNDNYLAIIKPVPLEIIKKQNELKNFQLKFSSINNDRTNNTANTTKYPTISEESLHRSNLEISMKKNYETSFAYPKSDNTVVNYLCGNSSRAKVCTIRQPSKTPLISEMNNQFAFDLNTTGKSAFLTDRLSKTSGTVSSKRESTIERRSENLNRDNNKELNSIDTSSKNIDRLKLKIISSHNKKHDLSKYVHKYVASTLNNWSKLKKNSVRDYSSGDFNLPLVTKISTREKTE